MHGIPRLAALAALFIFSVAVVADVSTSYRRVLPLEGGSNFRDMGGYVTQSGQAVVRGKLFRSGAMSSLTQSDMAYLDEFGFKTVVDMRSDEEIELYPNHWAEQHEVHMITGGYSINAMLAEQSESDMRETSVFYPRILKHIEPQLKSYFAAALDSRAPLVVNCSAGQDRTGITAALMLTLLGVPEAIVIEDYLLSTDFRKPLLEKGNVDLAEAAKTNSFAAMLLEHERQLPHPDRPNSLVADDGTPFLSYVFDHIRAEYGSIENYAAKQLGVDSSDVEKLKTLYLN